MLAKRVIPTVLVRGKTAYKGPGFGAQCTRSVGSALSICRTHAMRGVDELLILDIGATPEGRGPDLDLVRELSAGCFIPITVGGGVKTLGDIDALLRAGADKVCIGSGATLDNLVESAAERFGRQAIVVALDLASDCVNVGPSAAAVFERQGAGEIVLQSVDREGAMCGYDTDLIREVSAAVSIPVIASCGCSGPEDMLRAIRAGADGVAAGALFQFTDETPRSCVDFLKRQGVEVRQ